MPKRTRNESPQKQVMREMMQQYLKKNDIRIKDDKNVKSIMLLCQPRGYDYAIKKHPQM